MVICIHVYIYIKEKKMIESENDMQKFFQLDPDAVVVVVVVFDSQLVEH